MIQRILIALVLCVAGLALSRPAAAQGTEVGIDYSFIRLQDGGSVNMPKGFLASVASGKGAFSLVGELGANYKSATGVLLQVYTFQAGPRFTNRDKPRAHPYVEFLFGAMHLRVLGESTTKFSFEPAAGLEIPFKKHKRMKARVGIGVPFVFADNENLHGLRVHGGFVFAVQK